MIYKTRNEFHHEAFVLAKIRKRFMAYFLDWIILILIYLGIIFLLSIFSIDVWKVNIKSFSDVEIDISNTPTYVVTLIKVLFGLLPLFYFTLSFYFFKGQTIGKYLFRLKVVSLYHEKIGLWHCIERSLGYFASALEFGFGYIQAFWNPNRMALHDKIGETIVIALPRKERKMRLKRWIIRLKNCTFRVPLRRFFKK
jgi:uncharacterized RDD family membrane protein YckC